MNPQNYTLPKNWIMLKHAAITSASGQIDVILALDMDKTEKHLIQVVDGKSSTIRSGDSAQANFDNIITKAPGVEIFA